MKQSYWQQQIVLSLGEISVQLVYRLYYCLYPKYLFKFRFEFSFSENMIFITGVLLEEYQLGMNATLFSICIIVISIYIKISIKIKTLLPGFIQDRFKHILYSL